MSWWSKIIELVIPSTKSSDFDRALKFLGPIEGGYVNDPTDRGGETKYGISKRSYPHLDIKSITKEQMAAIYKRDFWDKMGCDTMQWPINLIVFDSAVNHGPLTAQALLKRTPKTSDLRTYCHNFLNERIDLYKRLIIKRPSQIKFKNGWFNRVEALRAVVREL